MASALDTLNQREAANFFGSALPFILDCGFGGG